MEKVVPSKKSVRAVKIVSVRHLSPEFPILQKPKQQAFDMFTKLVRLFDLHCYNTFCEGFARSRSAFFNCKLEVFKVHFQAE